MPGPANLYGVANPSPPLVVYSGGGDLALTPGTETNVISSAAIVAPSGGWFYPVVWTTITVVYGATPPTLLTLGGRIGAGADFANVIFDGNTYAATTQQQYIYTLIGPASQVAWQGAGSIVNVTLLAATTSCTFRAFASRAAIGIFRAPDQ